MEKFDQQPKTPEQLSNEIIETIKAKEFNNNQIEELISKLQNLKSKEPVNEQKEQNFKDKIMFSLLRNGWTPNKSYGNQETNYYSFDLRDDQKIMDLIHNQKSFITTIIKNNIKYKVIGLALDSHNKEFAEYIKHDNTSGRSGYVFAVIEDNENLPNNINEIMITESTQSAKAYFTDIKDWNDVIIKPIEIQ